MCSSPPHLPLFRITTALSVGFTVAIAPELLWEALGVPSLIAVAQVTPDGTLATTVTSSDNLNFLIEVGEQAGSNLFHSFEQFSIPANGSGVFNNAANIANIFSRVTGGDVSNIQGSISANGTANLFLINPSGIIFGENASLNIGGSFFATTAEELVFDDGLAFSATHPNSSVPLLSINVSPGLQMGQQSGSITINGPGHSILGGGLFPFLDNGTASGLQVNPGQTLGIIAPDIYVSGGIIKVPEGTIQLSGVSEGLLNLSHNQNRWVSDSSTVQHFGDIQFSRQSLVQSHGVLRGDIHLQGRTIRIADGSLVMLQNLGPQLGGEILIDATESLQLLGAARIGPDQDTILGTIPGVALSRINNETVGNASTGGIKVSSGQIQMEDGSSINTRSYGSGSAGKIDIDVTDTIDLEGTSTVAPNLVGGIGSLTFGSGNAGDLQVTSQNLFLLNGMGLLSGTFGSGNGGEITVRVTQDLIIDGIEPTVISPSGISSGAFGTGDSGNLGVSTARLSVLNGGVLVTSTYGSGNAGNLTVNASERIQVSGSVPNLRASSAISSSAPILDEALRQQLGIADQPSGNSGNVQINTPHLMIMDGASVSANNQGFGDSGHLEINANEIVLTQGKISALSTSGQGGDIELNLDQFLLLNHDSSVTAEAIGRLQSALNRRTISRMTNPELTNVDGGNIVINAPFILGFNNSDITANAFEGNGGNISISTQGLFGLEFRDRSTPNSDITASSEFGLDGIVEITNPNADPNSQILELSETLVDISQLIRPGCSLEQDQFVLTGRGGLPNNPLDLMNGDRPWTDTRDLSAFLNNPSDNPASTTVEQPTVNESFQEATGMAIASNGAIQLLTSNANSSITPHPTCTSNPNAS